MARSTMICISAVIASLAFTGRCCAAIDPNSILGIWLLDEGQGSTTKDASGNGYDGTLMGSPTWIGGHFGSALQFNGSSTYVTCGNDVALNVGLFSVSFWCNIPATQAWNHMISRGQHVASGTPGSVNWGVMMYEAQQTILFETFNDTGWTGISTATTTGEWHHVVATYDGSTMQLYHDGALGATTSGAGILLDESRAFLIGARSDAGAAGGFFNGSLDEVGYFNAVLTLEDIQTIMSKGLAEIIGGTPEAADPQPVNGATDVPRDRVLGWTAGMFAATHDVYLGTSLDDVGNASRDNPLNVLVSQGQADAAYSVDSPLEYGQTYYWRVDEVNGAPDHTIFEGAVWSFTVEPYAYPITSLTATASSAQGPSPASRTIDGSGLDEFDRHGVDLKTMWATPGGLPAWIEYTFDKEYKLHELWVWNTNSELESYMGFGAKGVAIEYSADGQTWTALENVPEFAQGTGTATYTANTIVDFGEVMAKHVRLTINTTWGATGITGLSEVRFFYSPAQAFEPAPADGATGVDLDATLNWRPGREVTSHEVSFGTDPTALAADTVTEHSYTPASMAFGTKYYWKVDELGDAGTYEGSLWSFTTEEFAPIDDFESYTDNMDARETIWDTWTDGVTTKASGSQVGYTDAPFAEKTIVHGGMQSMPLMYNNAGDFFFSEAEREFESAQNWTGNGASELCLWVRGNAAKFVETAPGQYTISSNTADIWGTSDNFRFVYKRLSGNGSISAKVLSITGGSTTWAKAGVMVRESLDPASSYALMHPTPDGRRAFQNRPSSGASAVSAHSNTGAVTLPVWVKVERQGNQVTAYYSQNGTTWTKQPDTENTGTDRSPNPQTINMADPIYIGLAVTSNNTAGGFCFGEFSDVVITGNVTGDWTVASVGANPGNDAAPMYVTVADSAGKSGTATNADIVTVADWTRWVIPMSDFAGVNFSKVKKMVITIGDKTATTAGGTGIVFIDDIGYGRSAE
ncbi:MAG: LamG-like jellyroll fold domain-containing protein [Phycisphaerales bacterium]